MKSFSKNIKIESLIPHIMQIRHHEKLQQSKLVVPKSSSPQQKTLRNKLIHRIWSHRQFISQGTGLPPVFWPKSRTAQQVSKEYFSSLTAFIISSALSALQEFLGDVNLITFTLQKSGDHFFQAVVRLKILQLFLWSSFQKQFLRI